jgi:hypothetical protein
MTSDPSQTVHSIVITRLKDETSKAKVAAALVRVSKGVSNEQIMKRLDSLPWTITRRASEKKAARLLQLLETLGATTSVTPPFRTALLEDVHQTQLLPETQLLSDSQVKSGLQDVQAPEARPPYPAVPVAKAPADTGEKTAPQEGFTIEPLTLGGILDRSFQICRGHFWKLLGIMIIPWIAILGIVAAVAATVALAGIAISLTDLQQHLSVALIVAAVIGGIAFFLVVIVSFFVAQGAAIHAVSNIYLGREVFIGSSYRFVFGRLWKFIFTTILFAFVFMLSLVVPTLIGAALYYLCEKVFGSGLWSIASWPLLALVPMYVFFKTGLFDKAVIIENLGYMSAIKRSWNLIKGKADSAWPRGYFIRLIILFHLFILIQIAVGLLLAPISLTAELLTPEGYSWIGQVISQIASNLGSLVGQLFGVVCMVVFYYDIRNRKEGFDIKMLAKTRK